MTELTMKQEGFVQSLRAGESQRQAYKNNYNVVKMTDDVVDQTACRLLASPKVNARYQEVMTELREKANQEGLMDATELLRKLNELILRNENEDDRLALEGIKTLGKNLGTFVDKVEHSGKIEMPGIIIGK